MAWHTSAAVTRALERDALGAGAIAHILETRTSREIHPAACEAAAAVRLARERGTAAQLEAWLWAHQSTLTRDVVFQAAREVAGVENLKERYASLLQQVRFDVELAHKLNVPGTPTYFINGVKLTLIPPGDFETAIRHELRSAERQASVAR